MKLDSATTANMITLLGVNIHWGVFFFVFMILAFATLIIAMRKGVVPKIMDFVLELKKNNTDTADMATTIQAIRADQLESNKVRIEHGVRLDAIEEIIKVKVCGNAETCVNRVELGEDKDAA